MTQTKDLLPALVMQVLKASSRPLSLGQIASLLLQTNNDLAPHPIYNPSLMYRRGERLYYTSSKYGGWFVVEDADREAIDALFDDGRRMRMLHGCAWRYERPPYPITPEEYLAKDIEALLPTLPGLYCSDGFWYNHPIEEVERLAVERRPPTTGVPKSIERPRDSLSTNRQPLTQVKPSSQNIPTPKDELLPEEIRTVCQQHHISCFYHITHIQNLPGIFAQGLLCKKKAKPSVDISNQEIQSHRSAKRLPQYPNKTLHDYVPLFIAHKPPMLSALREQQPDLVYLHIDPKVLTLPQVVFTDGNARSDATEFYSRLEDLNCLDWAILRARYWKGDDPEQHLENKRRRSAEILVPGLIPASHVQAVTVMTLEARDQVLKILQEGRRKIPVRIDQDMYYPLTNRRSNSGSQDPVGDDYIPEIEPPFLDDEPPF